jgi:L-alanine-DL-glutamate epimerase-like enolase superfamily enzyme
MWDANAAIGGDPRRDAAHREGELVAPPGPGLGLALDEAAVRRHRVT